MTTMVVREKRRLNSPWRAHLRAMGLLLLLSTALLGCAEPETIVAVPPTSTPDLPPVTPEPTATPVPIPKAKEFPLAAPRHVGIERPADQTCVECHTDAMALRESVEVQPVASPQVEGGSAAELEVLTEPWEKAYLDRDEFFETSHGRYGCTSCHNGRGDTMVKATAHTDLTAEPSTAGACQVCHCEEVTADQSSLHTDLTGYRTALIARTSASALPKLETIMDNHCQSCHTATCGQCHVSRPEQLGGGLVDGHLFNSTPAVNSTCAGCHGNRIESEYKGRSEAAPADIHWTESKMLCSDCHVAAEFHGELSEFVHRYDGRPIPSCQASQCHPDVASDDGVEQHAEPHLFVLSCQACHSTTYTNCYGCHVAMQDGEAVFQVEAPVMAFKIGRNPLQGRYRPWKYVPVRHVPVERDTFAYYGNDLLTNFDALPTWTYATPHNIQRVTPQTASCNSCHGNPEFFLTDRDIALDEAAANQRIVVDQVPAPID